MDKRAMCESILASVNQDFSDVQIGHTVRWSVSLLEPSTIHRLIRGDVSLTHEPF